MIVARPSTADGHIKESAMVANGLRTAKLTPERLSEVRDLERRLGVVLVALEPQFTVAKLPATRLRRIQALEKHLGVVLVAYQRQ
jgi:hypothetical protein